MDVDADAVSGEHSRDGVGGAVGIRAVVGRCIEGYKPPNDPRTEHVDKPISDSKQLAPFRLSSLRVGYLISQTAT
jgi:hypothetical protein